MSIKAWIQDWSLGHAVRRQTVLKGTRLVAEGRLFPGVTLEGADLLAGGKGSLGDWMA